MRGGKRPGAGRPKGSIRTLLQQDYDLFRLIEDRCAALRWKYPRLYGHDFIPIEDGSWFDGVTGDPVIVWKVPARSRLVRRVCQEIAEKYEISWVHNKTGQTLTKRSAKPGGGHKAVQAFAHALMRTYYRVRKQYEAAGVEFWWQEDPTSPDRLAFNMRGPTDRWPKEDFFRYWGHDFATMSITQKIKRYLRK